VGKSALNQRNTNNLPSIGLILGWVGVAAQGLTVGVGSFRWKQHSASQQVLTILLACTLINQLVSQAATSWMENTTPFFHAYVLMEFVGIWLIYHSGLRGFIPKPILYTILGIGLVACLASAFIFGDIYSVPDLARTTESLIIIGFVGAYFIMVVTQLNQTNLAQSFLFWLSTGLLIYFAANMLLSLFGNALANDVDHAVWDAIYSIHGVLNILLYIALTISLLCKDHR